MNGFNRVILAGNLTRDPELRYTPKGTAIAKIGLAVNRTYTSENGEKKEEVNFIDVEAWSKQAEVISQYLKKGSPILLEGRLRLDTWEDKNTHQKVSKLKVVLESFNFIGTGRTDGASSEGQAPRPRPPAASQPAAAPAAAPAEPDAGGGPEEDDVPF
jgi:single-strand DNA-binding protein